MASVVKSPRGLSWLELFGQLQSSRRDDEAWEEMFRRLQALAKHLDKVRELGDGGAESCQRVISKLFRTPRLLESLASGESDPARYLIVMLYHAAADIHRERRRGVFGKVKPLGDHLSSEAPSPEDEAIRREMSARLQSVLERHFSPEQRQILNWRFRDDLPIGEIAQSLGIRYHAAAMRIRRLQQELLAILGNSKKKPP